LSIVGGCAKQPTNFVKILQLNELFRNKLFSIARDTALRRSAAFARVNVPLPP
jgi:hypothetical protein